MEESRIALKVEEETKNLHKLAEKLEEVVKYEFDKGVENVDTKEMSEVIDMLKDVYEAMEKVVKACYYKQIMEAMEEEGFDDEEDIMDYGRKGYDNYRYKRTGRFAPKGKGSYMPRRGYDEVMYPAEMYRDMDYDMGKMYYSGNIGGGSQSGQSGSSNSGNMNSGSSSRNYGGERDSRQNESRYDRARRTYTETKEMHRGNTAEEKQKKMKELENYTKELAEDVTEMISDASPEEKALLKQKMATLMQKIG